MRQSQFTVVMNQRVDAGQGIVQLSLRHGIANEVPAHQTLPFIITDTITDRQSFVKSFLNFAETRLGEKALS